MTDRTAATVDLDVDVRDLSVRADDWADLGYSTAAERVGPRSTRPRGGLVVITVVVVAFAAVVGIASSTSSTRSSNGRGRNESADVVGRYNAALSERDWAALERLLAPDLAFHDVDLELLQDRAGFLAWAKVIAESYPDFAVDIDDARVDGDVAVVRFSEHQDDVEGVERIRTQRSVAISGVVVLRVVDERIVEMWSNYDEFGLLHQRAVSSATRG